MTQVVELTGKIAIIIGIMLTQILLIYWKTERHRKSGTADPMPQMMRTPFAKPFPLTEGFKRLCTVISAAITIVVMLCLDVFTDEPITLVRVIYLALIPATLVASQLTLLTLFTVIISRIKWIKEGFKQDRENGQKQ